MKKKTTYTAVLLGGALALAGCVEQVKKESVKPNFLIFIADDLGWEDSGPYGSEAVQTPNINRLANEGCRYDRAFLTTSSSSPSRASIMTGMYPHSTHAENLHQPLPTEAVTVATPLRANGYYTMSVGKWHLGSNVTQQFDTVIMKSMRQRNTMGDDWVEALAARPKDKPFFMWAASNDPHRPFFDIEEHITSPEEVVLPPYYPDTPEMREDLANYYNCIARFDRHVGIALKELERQGVLDNTVIVVMSDNGRPFPQCKTRTNQQGMRTPFIIRYPGKVTAGSISNTLISSIDLMPTLLEMSGTEFSSAVDGVSFAAILDSPRKPHRQYAFSEHNWHDFRAFERAVYTDRFVYTINFLPELPATPPRDAFMGKGYQSMIEMHNGGKLEAQYSDCFVFPRAEAELFDYLEDIHCMTSLSGEEKYSETESTLRKVLLEHMAETIDSFPGKEDLRPDLFDRKTGDKLEGVTFDPFK